MRTPLTIGMLLVAAIAVAAPRKISSLQVTSSAFAPNGDIPVALTCDGEGRSPPLAWSGVPPGTRSIAILVEDPDAPRGAFLHWLVTGISPSTTQLAAGTLPPGATAAKNDAGKPGYIGPCPPRGKHHYYFRVYALDTQIAKPATKVDFLTAITGHVLAQGELVGTYERHPRGARERTSSAQRP